MQRRIEALSTEARIVRREGDVGIDVAARRDRVAQQLADANAQLQALQARYAEEKKLGRSHSRDAVRVR